MTQLRTPDGSRRRRRSVQPVKTARKRRFLWIGLGVGLLAIVVGAYFGFRLFLRMRLEGETFRDGVNRNISSALGCEVEFRRIFDGGDNSLAATESRFTTGNQDLIESGEFNGLSAAMTATSWVADEWGIRMLSIHEARIKLNPFRTPGNSPAGTLPVVTGGRKAEGGYRLGINPEPDRISLDAVRFQNGLSLEWPSADAASPESLSGLQGTVNVRRGKGVDGFFKNGKLTLNLLPEIDVDSMQWSLNGRKLEISNADIIIGGKPDMLMAGKKPKPSASVSGVINLVNDGEVQLRANFSSTPLKNLLSKTWQDLVLGLFSAENATFITSTGKGPERVFEGDFKIAGAIVQGFSFTEKLAVATQRPEFSRPEFPILAGHFKWTPSGGMELTGLSGTREGMFRLSGNVTVSAQDAVSGRLTVGLHENIINGMPEKNRGIAGPVEEGCASLDINLAGNGNTISDDLNAERGKTSANDRTAEPGAPAPAAPAPRTPGATRRSKPSNAELEKQFQDLLPDK